MISVSLETLHRGTACRAPMYIGEPKQIGGPDQVGELKQIVEWSQVGTADQFEERKLT